MLTINTVNRNKLLPVLKGKLEQRLDNISFELNFMLYLRMRFLSNSSQSGLWWPHWISGW